MRIRCSTCRKRVDPYAAQDYNDTRGRCQTCWLQGQLYNAQCREDALQPLRLERITLKREAAALQAELDATKLKLCDAVLRASTAELDLLRAQIENSVLCSKLLAKHLEYLELMADMDNK